MRTGEGTARERPTRPTLSRAHIVAVALALIDDLGQDRFSMRKLGGRLGADPMAVYRYVADREALFDGIAEALFDELDSTSLPWQRSWRQLCEEFFGRLRDVLLRHPHAVTIFATRPVRSAAAIEGGNRLIALLRDAGFDPVRALQLTRCLREFTVGHVLTLTVVELGGGSRSRKPDPGAPDYNLLAASADGAGIGDHFDLGLAAILDGFTPDTVP